MKIIVLLPQVNGMVYNHQTYVMKIEKNQLQLPSGTGGGGESTQGQNMIGMRGARMIPLLDIC